MAAALPKTSSGWEVTSGVVPESGATRSTRIPQFTFGSEACLVYALVSLRIRSESSASFVQEVLAALMTNQAQLCSERRACE